MVNPQSVPTFTKYCSFHLCKVIGDGMPLLDGVNFFLPNKMELKTRYHEYVWIVTQVERFATINLHLALKKRADSIKKTLNLAHEEPLTTYQKGRERWKLGPMPYVNF